MKSKTLKLISFLIAAVIFTTVAMIIPTTAEDQQSLYITQINKKVGYASGAIFTKAFNNSNTIKSSEGNFRWTKQIVCKPTDKAGVYELTEDPIGPRKNGTGGDPDEAIEFPENGFIYAAHIDDRPEAKDNGDFKKSQENQDRLAALKKGDKITLVGVDIKAGTIQSGAIIYIGDTTGGQTSSEPAQSTSQPAASSSASSSAAPTSSTSTSTSTSTSSAPAASYSTSSAAASSAPAASSTSSKQPQTGDTGILSVAILAIVSLAGASALSIRKRSR